MVRRNMDEIVVAEAVAGAIIAAVGFTIVGAL